MSAILALSHIRFCYILPGPEKPTVPVFQDLSFALAPGEKVGLIEWGRARYFLRIP